MLYPKVNNYRNLLSLDGIWKFKCDFETEVINPEHSLRDYEYMAVPGSFNDQTLDLKVRQHSGYFWYEIDFNLPKSFFDERIVLRFGSVTHEAWVYINGKEVCHHKGGFTPFEVEINDFVLSGKNRLTVKVSNILDYTSLPVGNYSEYKDDSGKLIRKVDENFDFFNYAGIHRPVKIYTTPRDYIEDISISYDVDLGAKVADVKTKVASNGNFDEIKIEILDQDDKLVACSSVEETNIRIEEVNLWEPLNAYLYTARVSLIKSEQVIDVYEEEFGVRTIEVKDAEFLINGKPFYFKGFGKHEDTYVNGRGLNEAYNVLDLKLMKKMGANSFRTSHYPYSEEMMRLCDKEGIVVIDEIPAVGLILNFGFNVATGNEGENTWVELKTKEMHEQVIKELIGRDKNHACVVMWSLSNEAADFIDGSLEYYKPLFELAKSLDPQKRPCTNVLIGYSNPETTKNVELFDVICLNRYYGWYGLTGDLEQAEKFTRADLQSWVDKYPDKPIMYTEYGADTINGMHSAYNEPFSEEYQMNYYKMNSKVFDEFDNFVGEQLWNFADFQTKFGIQRVMGNRKGVFTRERQPKMAATYLSERWNSIPDFGYKE